MIKERMELMPLKFLERHQILNIKIIVNLDLLTLLSYK